MTKKDVTLAITNALVKAKTYSDSKNAKDSRKLKHNEHFLSSYTDALLTDSKEHLVDNVLTAPELVCVLLGAASLIQQQIVDKNRMGE